MQEYIKKLEDENARLVEELGKKEALISSTPFNSTLYISFGLDYTFDGGLCGFIAALSYAYVNPHTGNKEDKYIKTFKVDYDPHRQGKDYRWWISNLLTEIDADLRSYFNTRIQSFKTDPMSGKNPSEDIPWINIPNHENMFISGLDENMLFDLFKKQKVVSLQPFKRISRWTRFKQLLKGI
jgi:hypothetical protein